MNAQWLPITYRDFYDIPRAFIVEREGQLYFFDCAFDEGRDDYPDEFHVYTLPSETRERLSAGSWSALAGSGELLGVIPVAQVQFDESRRHAIRESSLELVRRP